ncbi:MAG: hypothetical protein ACRCS8_06005 [Brevinema sp.]
MSTDGRHFITFAEPSHPLLQEMPEEFRSIWFKQYYCEETGERLFLRMERIFEKPNQKNSAYADLLTFEVASLDDLLEWEEDHGEKEFIAMDPDYIFFDEMQEDDEAQFSIGVLNRKTMDFEPELEVLVSIVDGGIIIDYQDDDEPVYWQLV